MNDPEVEPELEVFGKLAPKVKRLWIEALRSGRFVQVRDRLIHCKPAAPPSCLKDVHSSHCDGFCCIGVLGVVIAKLPYVGYALANAVGAKNKLVELNDGERLNFNQIADWVEENL